MEPLISSKLFQIALELVIVLLIIWMLAFSFPSFRSCWYLPIFWQLPEVQAAIHVTRPPPGGVWEDCQGSPTLNYTTLFMNMLNYYNFFFDQSDIKVMVYSGDIDIATVPHAYTQHCLSQLNRPTTKKWRLNSLIFYLYFYSYLIFIDLVVGPFLAQPSQLILLTRKQRNK